MLKRCSLWLATLLFSCQTTASADHKAALNHYADLAHSMYEDARVAARSPYQQMRKMLDNTLQKMRVLATNALRQQTQKTETVVATLSLGELAFEGSDSLDAPDTISQSVKHLQTHDLDH